jgi:hypothetical protein
MPWSLYSQQNSYQHPLSRRLCGPQNWSGWSGEEKNLLILPGINCDSSVTWPIAWLLCQLSCCMSHVIIHDIMKSRQLVDNSMNCYSFQDVLLDAQLHTYCCQVIEYNTWGWTWGFILEQLSCTYKKYILWKLSRLQNMPVQCMWWPASHQSRMGTNALSVYR